MSTRMLEAGAVHVPAQDSPAARRRGIVRTTWVVSAIALTFYVGFIVMMVLRAIH
jgi:hypothetical protein